MSSNAPAATSQRVAADKLHAWCRAALEGAGAKPTHATTVADALVTTDAWGVFTHGSKLLRAYIKRIVAGGLRTDLEPMIVNEGPAFAIVDGNSTLGLVTADFAMRAAIAKAKTAGIAYVGVRNSSHFGAAGYYASLAAREGLIGIAMANDIPSVAAPGSRGAITGSNPLAYGVPAGKHPPILLDMAISTVAGGKVYAAFQQGKPIPNNWIVGPDGLPTTDASLYPHTASLVPMGGHKGYGIALLIETLSAALSGAAMTWGVGNWIFGDATTPTNHGAAMLALDVATIAERGAFAARIDALIDEIHAAPTAVGTERLLVPGEMEWERGERALAEGILLPPDVVASLEGLAADQKLDLAKLWGRT